MRGYFCKDRKTKVIAAAALMIASIFTCLPIVSTEEESPLWITPALDEEAKNVQEPLERIATDAMAGDIMKREGDDPFYVLVVGDEEEQGVYRGWEDPLVPYGWRQWAEMQVERGDNTLSATFGTDIRIVGFENWDSNDTLDSSNELWYELSQDYKEYLGKVYGGGKYWRDKIDAVIGITSQATPTDPRGIAGLSPGPGLLWQGRNFILLRWQIYWGDDNLVQHEVSHLFFAPDHEDDDCCAMQYHVHWQTAIWEDGCLCPVLWNVPCTYTAYVWHNNCSVLIASNSARYENDDINQKYIVAWWQIYDCGPATFRIYDEQTESYSDVTAGGHTGTRRK